MGARAGLQLAWPFSGRSCRVRRQACDVPSLAKSWRDDTGDFAGEHGSALACLDTEAALWRRIPGDGTLWHAARARRDWPDDRPTILPRPRRERRVSLRAFGPRRLAASGAGSL